MRIITEKGNYWERDSMVFPNCYVIILLTNSSKTGCDDTGSALAQHSVNLQVYTAYYTEALAGAA